MENLNIVKNIYLLNILKYIYLLKLNLLELIKLWLFYLNNICIFVLYRNLYVFIGVLIIDDIRLLKID